PRVAATLVAADVDVDPHGALAVAVDDGVGDVLERGEGAPGATDDLAGIAAVDLDEDLVFGRRVDLDGVAGVDVEQEVDEEGLGALGRVTLDDRRDAVGRHVELLALGL